MQIQKRLPWLSKVIGIKIMLYCFFTISVLQLNGQPPCTGPTITIQPTNQSACLGSNASFSIAAIGIGTLSYQWQENQGSGFTNIALANNASYMISAVTASQNNYTYQVIITDDNGTPANNSDDCTVTSTVATLSVISIICDSSPWSGNN